MGSTSYFDRLPLPKWKGGILWPRLSISFLYEGRGSSHSPSLHELEEPGRVKPSGFPAHRLFGTWRNGGCRWGVEHLPPLPTPNHQGGIHMAFPPLLNDFCTGQEF